MSALTNLYAQSQLALASYGAQLSTVDLSSQLTSDTNGIEMSVAQADQFIQAGWTVVARYPATPAEANSAFGAAATVFQDKDGKRYIAVRGTEGAANDLLTDANLALIGVRDLNPQYNALLPVIKQWASPGPNGEPPLLQGDVTIAGHSLGGYLAAQLKDTLATTTADTGTFRITEAYVFNAPGGGGLLGSLSRVVDGVFGIALFEQPGTTRVSSSGVSVTEAVGAANGVSISLTTELAGAAPLNHSMHRITDTLAVMAVYETLFGASADIATLNKVADFSGVNKGEVPNEFLDVLRRLVFGPSAPPTGETRAALFDNITALTNEISSKGLAGTCILEDFSGWTTKQLADTAAMDTLEGAAVRRALTCLTPIGMASPALPVAPLYADYSPVYWADRAGFLERLGFLAQANMAAVNHGISLADYQNLPDTVKENIYWSDLPTGLKIEQGPVYGTTEYRTFGGDTPNAVQGGGAEDYLFGGGGVDTITGGAGNDVLEGGDSNDTLDGGAGSDTLYGGIGDDTLGGTSIQEWWSNTYSNGVAGPYVFTAEPPKFDGNIYTGGTGNDLLRGTYGTDTYRFNLGDGQDTISERGLSPASSAHGVVDQGDDVLEFGADIAAADIKVTRNGTDLVLKHSNGTDQVTVKSWYSETAGGYKLAEVRFADGTVRNTEWLTKEGLKMDGTDSAETLMGVALFDNVLKGFGGIDVLTGGNLSDTLYGGDGNDTLDGGAGSDILYGGAGNDTLGGVSTQERWSNTYSNGVAGPYVFTAEPPKFEGNTYVGGTGNDTLRGTYGSDTYRFDLGDGQDTVYELGLSPSSPYHGAVDQGDDVLAFGDGINPADIKVTRSGTDLVLKHSNGSDQVTIKSWYSTTDSGYKLTEVRFADGTVWNTDQLTTWGLTVDGTDGAESLTGVALFNNILKGFGGNDTLTGGGLADTLYGGDGNDTLDGGAGADVLYGGNDNDILRGGDGDDILIGGSGNDVLQGGNGNDTYIWDGGLDTVADTGGTDVVEFSGITVAMAQFFKGSTGSDLTINVGDAGSGMIFKNQLLATGQPVEQFKFADATLTAAEVQSMAILKV